MKMTIAEFRDKLVDMSKNGSFPSIGVRTMPSGYKSYFCMYRGENGKGCAASPLIPPELFDVGRNEDPFDDVVAACPEVANWIPDGMAVVDVLDVQRTHDLLAMAHPTGPWPHDEFVKQLSKLDCFADLPHIV